jgi:hypothetical protein
MAEFNLPTETVVLPSKGLLYPEDSPLAKGELEMKYMTAKEEDILSNQNFIVNGTVIDKLLQSLIVDKSLNYGELLIGDKNAIMVAARILSYGKDYTFKDGLGTEITVDLSELENKEVDYSLFVDRKNDFEFNLPTSGNVITFKLLTHKDEIAIEQEIKGNKKLHKDNNTDITTRLKHMITSINGSREQKTIREFVDTALLAKDARALREYYRNINPDVLIEYVDGREERKDLPIGVSFFWPDAGI